MLFWAIQERIRIQFPHVTHAGGPSNDPVGSLVQHINDPSSKVIVISLDHHCVMIELSLNCVPIASELLLNHQRILTKLP